MKNILNYIKRNLVVFVYQYVMGGIFILLIVGYPQLKAEHPLMDTDTYMWGLGALLFVYAFLVFTVVRWNDYTKGAADAREEVINEIGQRAQDALEEYRDIEKLNKDVPEREKYSIHAWSKYKILHELTADLKYLLK